ncbi:MAG TPA: DUF1223 domain-containing protein [Steroidobacteraceae bacterium]|nr:DUF1223 domain-containing protein [Steroidobacteraceae bacterium]
MNSANPWAGRRRPRLGGMAPLLLVLPALLQAEDCARPGRPLVIELFTSQGCSSCPPAETAVSAFAARPDVLALAYHVDYWDSLGWVDPFSRPDWTRRQEQYADALRQGTIGTPQMIVDGRRILTGPLEIRALPLHDPGTAGVPVRLALEGGALSVHLDAGSGLERGDVTLIPYLGRAVTVVRAGENAGRTLVESHVVLGQRSLGAWLGRGFDERVALSEMPAAATHVAVLVQQAGPGAILGAVCVALPSRTAPSAGATSPR